MSTRTPEPNPGRYAEAETLARAGRIAEAVAAAERALPRHPGDHEAAEAALALARLGRLAEAAGQPEPGLRALDRACRLRGRWPDLHFLRGRLLVQLRRPAEARRAIERALEQNPAYAAARVELALLDAAEGRLGEALEALRALGRPADGAEAAAFERGLACLERADWEEAARLLNGAMLQPAGGLNARLDELRARIERGEVEIAAALLRECVRHHEHYPDVHALLGTAELRLGRADDALASLGRALELNPGFHAARLDFARALDALGQRMQASEQVLLVLQHEPGHVEARELHRHWTRRGHAAKGA